MPVNKVKKVNLIVHDSVYDQLILKLQESGIIHIDEKIMDNLEKELNIQKNEVLLVEEEKFKNYISIIERLFERVKVISVRLSDRKKEEFLDNFISKIETFSQNEFKRLIENFDYEKLLNEINDLLDKEKNLTNEIEKNSSRINVLLPVSNITIPLEFLQDSENCNIKLFNLSKIKYQQFLEELETLDLPRLYQFYYVFEYEGNFFFILVALKDIYQQIYQLIKKFGGEEYSIAEQSGTISENILNYQNKVDEDNKLIDQIYLTLFEIIEVHGKAIKAIYDEIFAKFAKEKVEQKFLKTESTKFIVGWIFEKNTEQFKNLIEPFKFVDYNISNPDENDDPPVEFNNKKIIQPYESLTELYSIPKYNEIDPTPLIAPIYPILFGICLGDVGYGVLLFIGSLFLLKKFKDQKLIKVFMQSSIFTIIFGVLTGTYFGTRLDLLKQSAPKLTDFIEKFIWFDPLSNPMKLLVLSLQLGIFQMASSFVVAFITQLKAKEYYKALTQTLAYLIITIAGSFLVSTMFGFVLPPIISKIFAIASGLSLVSLLVFSANNEKTFFEKGIGKFFAVYNVAGIMGDILSFSRLLALGLSTSVIAMVANITAQIVRGSKFNPISWILSLIPLLALHGINFLLGLLGSFVHSMRLQFVEFFKNFYEGGGRRWSPFKRIHKFSVIVKQ